MHILKLLARFIPPYKWKVVLNFVFNLLSTVLSLFSFATIIPALQLLFGISDAQAVYTPLEGLSIQETVDAVKGNVYYYLQQMMDTHGGGYVLVILGLFLVVATFFKCLSAWLANFYMVPIRTGTKSIPQ